MIYESKAFKKQIGCFSSLVSQAKQLKILNSELKKLGVKKSKIIEMGQGQKQSRILLWWF